MKKIVLFLTTMISLSFFAQNEIPSVEKSIYGVQTSILGVFIHNESKLSDKIALKSEIGLISGIGKTKSDDKVTYIIVPYINLEPRFYYNLKKRLAKNKKTANNNGNYISIKTVYIPDWWFVITNSNDYINNQIRILPSWGIKRTYGKHFTLEAGASTGLSFIQTKSTRLFYDIHFRLGYTF